MNLAVGKLHDIDAHALERGRPVGVRDARALAVVDAATMALYVERGNPAIGAEVEVGKARLPKGEIACSSRKGYPLIILKALETLPAEPARKP